MNEIRMKELAEKFASELKNRLDWNELVEVGNELDLSIDELEYFGWLDDNSADHEFGCSDCPHYYADCYDEDDMFEDGCMYCHYEGADELAPCADNEEPGYYNDYEENMPCDTYGMSACSTTCRNWHECHK